MKALPESSRNPRHRTLLATMYGCGLRVTEVAHLKVGDIDSARNWALRLLELDSLHYSAVFSLRSSSAIGKLSILPDGLPLR